MALADANGAQTISSRRADDILSEIASLQAALCSLRDRVVQSATNNRRKQSSPDSPLPQSMGSTVPRSLDKETSEHHEPDHGSLPTTATADKRAGFRTDTQRDSQPARRRLGRRVCAAVYG
jgi:hypothetical protein